MPDLQLHVITPSRVIVDETEDEVVAPGVLGEFGILPGHVPFITLLAEGEIKYKRGSSEQKLTVGGGLAEVRDDKVTILTDGVG